MKTFAVLGPKSMVGQQLIKQLKNIENINLLTIGRNLDCDIKIDLEKNSFYSKKEIKKIDVLFHCISSFEDNSTEGMKKNIVTNTMSALLIIDLLEHYSINQFIYTGSFFSSKSYLKENISSYGLSKSLAEKIFSYYCENTNKKFLSLRFSQINDSYGICIKHQPWFGRIIRYTSEGLDLNMPKEKSLNNFLHVNDVANILISSCIKKLKGTYNVSHPTSYSYNEIARKAYKIFNKGGKIIENPKKIFSYVNFKYDDKIYQDLQFYPKWNIEDTIYSIKDKNTSKYFGPLDVK